MKKIAFLALALSSVLFSCDDEDGFYNEKYVDAPQLVNIEPQNVYLVGDYMYINADFSRYLNEEGFDTPLDIYRTTSGARGFVFSYTFERETSPGNWEAVPTTQQQMLIDAGSVQAGSYVLATALYNGSDETYEFRAGFPLTATGNYRISFGVNSDSRDEIELRSKTQGSNLFLNIISSTGQLDSSGFYHFTVN